MLSSTNTLQIRKFSPSNNFYRSLGRQIKCAKFACITYNVQLYIVAGQVEEIIKHANPNDSRIEGFSSKHMGDLTLPRRKLQTSPSAGKRRKDNYCQEICLFWLTIVYVHLQRAKHVHVCDMYICMCMYTSLH